MEKIMKLAALMREADKLAKEIIREGRENDDAFRVISADIRDGKMAVHIAHNLKEIGKDMGWDVVRNKRDDDYYIYEDSADVDGVKFFEILTDKEAQTA